MNLFLIDKNKFGLVPGEGKDPKYFQIVQIVRIQSKPAWERYALMKDHIRTKWPEIKTLDSTKV